jgi:hypothetical protein
VAILLLRSEGRNLDIEGEDEIKAKKDGNL